MVQREIGIKDALNAVSISWVLRFKNIALKCVGFQTETQRIWTRLYTLTVLILEQSELSKSLESQWI